MTTALAGSAQQLVASGWGALAGWEGGARRPAARSSAMSSGAAGLPRNRSPFKPQGARGAARPASSAPRYASATEADVATTPPPPALPGAPAGARLNGATLDQAAAESIVHWVGHSVAEARQLDGAAAGKGSLPRWPSVTLDVADEADGKLPAASQQQSRWGGSLQAMLLLNLGAFLFGSNQVAIKMVEEGVSASSLSALRFLIAAACFAPAVARGLRDPRLRAPALELGLWLFGGYCCQAVGLESTTATRSAFTGTFTVIAVPILVGLSGRRVAPTTWVAATVALGGVGLLTTSGAAFNSGDALCILSAVLFGVHKWRSETVTAAHAATTELVAVQLAVLALAASAVALPEAVGHVQQHGWAGAAQAAAGLPWPALVYMGAATTAATLWIEMHALKQVSAPLAALIYTAEPLWGAALAWALLGERWGGLGWLGAALITAASLGSQLAGDATRSAPPRPPARTD